MKRKSEAGKFLAVVVLMGVVYLVVLLVGRAFHLQLLNGFGLYLMGGLIAAILMPATLTGTATQAYQDRQEFLGGVDRIMAQRGWRRKTIVNDTVVYHPPAFVAPFMDGLAVDVSAPGTATLTGPNQVLNLLKNIS